MRVRRHETYSLRKEKNKKGIPRRNVALRRETDERSTYHTYHRPIDRETERVWIVGQLNVERERVDIDMQHR